MNIYFVRVQCWFSDMWLFFSGAGDLWVHGCSVAALVQVAPLVGAARVEGGHHKPAVKGAAGEHLLGFFGLVGVGVLHKDLTQEIKNTGNKWWAIIDNENDREAWNDRQMEGWCQSGREIIQAFIIFDWCIVMKWRFILSWPSLTSKGWTTDLQMIQYKRKTVRIDLNTVMFCLYPVRFPIIMVTIDFFSPYGPALAWGGRARHLSFPWVLLGDQHGDHWTVLLAFLLHVLQDIWGTRTLLIPHWGFWTVGSIAQDLRCD